MEVHLVQLFLLVLRQLTQLHRQHYVSQDTGVSLVKPLANLAEQDIFVLQQQKLLVLVFLIQELLRLIVLLALKDTHAQLQQESHMLALLEPSQLVQQRLVQFVQLEAHAH